MRTTLKGFKELARRSDALGLKPRSQPGDLYWVANRVIREENRRFWFANNTDDHYHPVLVISMEGECANIRMLTSGVDRYKHRGMSYTPGPDAGLKDTSLILTQENYRLRVPAAALEQRNYKGNCGHAVLKEIGSQEKPAGERNDQ